MQSSARYQTGRPWGQLKYASVLSALAVVLTLGLLAPGSAAVAVEELEQRASWQPTSEDTVREQLAEWLEEQDIEDARREEMIELWGDASAAEDNVMLLKRLVGIFAQLDPEVDEVVQLCRQDERPVLLPEFAVLDDPERDDFVRDNLRLYYGRWLAQHRLIDESLDVLQELTPEQVVDPATLLFYQGVAYHRLIDKDNCLPRLAKLLENEQLIPRRYATVARLMEADLAPLEEDTLDEIARLMNDVQRRLDLGRAGARVREQEDEVIAKLDKLIEQMEQQQQAAAAAAAAGGDAQGGAPASPLPDSVPAGGSGPGDVDPRRLADGSDWGNLPHQERQEALQQIGNELPAHYREVIEEYFRKLAQEEN